MAVGRAAPLTALGIVWVKLKRAGGTRPTTILGVVVRPSTLSTNLKPAAGALRRRQRGCSKRKLDRGKPSEAMAGVRAAQLTFKFSLLGQPA